MRSIVKIMIVITTLVLAATAGAQPRPGAPRPGAGGGGDGAAGADGSMITFVQNEQLARIFTAAKFKSSVEKLKNGVQIVKMEIWPDTYSAAYPIFCKNDGTECGGYQIFVNLGDTGVNDAWIQAWNARYSFVRTYMLSKDQQIFEFDEFTQGGVTSQNIALSAAVFKKVVEESSDFKP